MGGAGAAALSSSSATLYTFSHKPSSPKSPLSLPSLTLNFPHNLHSSSNNNNNKLFALSYPISCFSSSSSSTRINATSSAPSSHSLPTTTKDSSFNCTHWIVVVKPPPQPSISKPQLVNYYVKTLEKVLGSEEDAQMCLYNASSDSHFGFCCVIDEETSRKLACLPEVLSVRPDLDFNSSIKDYSYSNDLSQSSSYNGGLPLFPAGNSKHWLVRVETPAAGVITKAQVVDYYVQILANVLGNEKDAQMCIYHISWQSNYGFCCELDDECAKELADVPGVLSVQPDQNVESVNKDYRGDGDSPAATDQPTNIKTKKLFVTGLSFYTSEKTLRAAFEDFGELVEVKIIMDKISKRSKGFAFIEYTTEEAASAALKEMNGKIINGWMIIVDVAKTNPPKYTRGQPRSSV